MPQMMRSLLISYISLKQTKMKAKRRYFSLNIEFSDRNELQRVLRKIAIDIKGPSNYNREMYETAVTEWAITSVEPEPYREEIIDGKLVHIYESKMNRK